MWLTDRDLRTIITTLAIVATGVWDEESYGKRPDFEGTLERVQASIRFREAQKMERVKSLRIEREASREHD